jgi:hypothetical protein
MDMPILSFGQDKEECFQFCIFHYPVHPGQKIRLAM